MKLTPIILEAAYGFLRDTPPFYRWGLPPEAEVTFRLGKVKWERGYYQWDKGHIIGISGVCVGWTDALVRTIAHEMIHLYQCVRKTDTRAEHNAEFRRLAKIVCRYHGFDPLEF